jgi:hypothetical protein
MKGADIMQRNTISPKRSIAFTLLCFAAIAGFATVAGFVTGEEPATSDEPAAAASSGGPYEIAWFTLESGGTSRGGRYVLTGVIGQADASPVDATGETWDLCGGFLVPPFRPHVPTSVAPGTWTLYE